MLGDLPQWDLNDLYASINDSKLSSDKIEIENKNQELLRAHKYLKEKIKKLELDVKKKLDFENNLNQEIEDLSQETENLVTEIEKWQM